MVDKLLKNTKRSYKEELKPFQHIFSAFESREKIPYFIKLFKQTGVEDKIIYIGCSWWPDSMFLTFLLIWYRHIVKWQDLSITRIIHINHNTSASDLFLQDIVVKNFWRIFDIYGVCFEKAAFTETKLRKKRWDFYKQCMQKSEYGQYVYLCLWHNLTDRIENSFLHFDRGTHIWWIVNMQHLQKKNLFVHEEMKTYTCFRPLLSFPKETITSWCDLFWVPYGNDSHNKDTTQKRIQYRNKIQSLPTTKQQQLYNEWIYVYTTLEKDISKQTTLTKIFFPSFWDIQWLYKADFPVTEHELVSLLSTIDQFTNMSKIRLQEMMKWFRKKEWSLYINWWWFLSAHGELFLAKQKQQSKFREKKYDREEQLTENIDIYTIAWYERKIHDSSFHGTILTFPAWWDMVWSKTYMKRAARQHIPFFRRRSLPILKKNNRIVAVLPSSLWPWK